MPATLNNKRILVTRPGHQTEHLCNLISENGGQAISFPTIEIQPVKDSGVLLSRCNAIFEYDFVIFVSRNAVKIAFDLYLDKSGLPKHVQILAICAGTADALSEMNITNVLHAGVKADSEALLQLSELQRERLQDKKILIVRGVGGRELLADTLKTRGALVDYAEVYRRCLPEYESSYIHEIWQDIKPAAVIITSNDGLKNLLILTLVNDQQQLFKAPLVVMSNRTAELAKDLGFVAEIRITKEKNDEGLLLALLELVGD